MSRIPRQVIEHHLKIYPDARPVQHVTSLDFKHFICILIVVVTLNQIKFSRFHLNSIQIQLRFVFVFSFKFCCDPSKVVNMKVGQNVLIYLLSKCHIF
jgi:hypothetical protein